LSASEQKRKNTQTGASSARKPEMKPTTNSAVEPGLFETSSHCLSLADPREKCTAVAVLAGKVKEGSFRWDSGFPLKAIDAPGRPELPELVAPSAVPRRRLGSDDGRAALVHAIAHIEFNAINLALDAVCRFRDMPESYYLDWISVAADEARHFQLLTTRLGQLGRQYGDYPAHNGLWEMAEKTSGSCLVRMALVPRVLEARGLDVTPGMIDRLLGVGDHETVAALEIILAEEIRHVAVGTHWFNYCCEQENKPPAETFLALLSSHYTGSIRGPFNLAARLAAGFTSAEMDALMAGID
jgi:uncharacterized ferritin-like protein (DUF455 family)